MIRSFYSGLLARTGNGRNTYKLVIRALVSVGILAALLWWLPVDALLQAVSAIAPRVWILVVCGFILGHIVSAFKWRLLLRAVDVNISGLEAVRAHGAGLFANLCLPSVVGGDVVRAGVVIRDHKRFENIALGSLADRINDSFALVVLAAIAGVFVPQISATAVGTLLAGVALMLLVGVLAGFAIIRWYPVSRLPQKLGGILLRFRSAMDSLGRAPMIASLAFFMSLGIQGSFVALNILLAHEIGIDAPPSLWFLAWPLAKLVALAPISLGGIGVREVAIAGLMAPFGIAPAVVVAQSLSWEAVLVGSGLFAGIVVAMLPGTGKKQQEETRRD